MGLINGPPCWTENIDLNMTNESSAYDQLTQRKKE